MMEDASAEECAKKPQNVTQKVAIDSTPIKAVSDYFKIKFEKNLLVKKKPEWDAPRISPATELVTAKRDLLAAEKLLQIERDEQNQNRIQMDKEWKDLLEKELNLRDAFLKFNKFIKENYEKRERAEQKIKEEKELQKVLDREIQELEDKVNYMKSIKDEMERHVEEHKIYENFLQQVIEVSSDLNSTHEILNRYETLASTRTELAARQERDLNALETVRTEMIKLTEEKSQMMMGLNNELAQLQIRYDRAKAMSLRWETALTRIKNISAEKALELDQVKISCWNLYTAMCARKNIEISVDPENFEEQLVFIKRSIQELKRILRIVQKKAAKEISSTTGQWWWQYRYDRSGEDCSPPKQLDVLFRAMSPWIFQSNRNRCSMSPTFWIANRKKQRLSKTLQIKTSFFMSLKLAFFCYTGIYIKAVLMQGHLEYTNIEWQAPGGIINQGTPTSQDIAKRFLCRNSDSNQAEKIGKNCSRVAGREV